ncbi:MAG TPA: hypothetical protein VK138_09675 [Acidiferrobacterales bacterium]|nr:hypothetical protein [Acidiferrobacterales bacterium]
MDLPPAERAGHGFQAQQESAESADIFAWRREAPNKKVRNDFFRVSLSNAQDRDRGTYRYPAYRLKYSSKLKKSIMKQSLCGNGKIRADTTLNKDNLT